MNRKKLAFVIIALFLVGLAIVITLRYVLIPPRRGEPLPPEFNIFDLEADGSSVEFNLQNIGEADAHNVSINVNGTWYPQIEVNITMVEEGYMVVPEQIATVFNGSFEGPIEDMDRLARMIIPSDVGMERDSEHKWLKIAAVENGTWRYLCNSEVALLREAFENPHPYYTSAEKTLDSLREGEIKTVEIHLEWGCDSFEILVSCDEGVTLEESVP